MSRRILLRISRCHTDPPENTNVTDKSWDHPWTTNEMRQHRDDWSLAADAGLLKHLQQFSDNLTERVQKTQEKLNFLSGELNEASVVIDNVTNVSLALANTQFIESRVNEDDVEVDRSRITEESETNKEEVYKEDLIARVSESIRQGLSVMDEKFERLEVLASDSEDEGELPTPSVVLKPKDPYQNRPLPYVIGTEKWAASSKVGLESSSSDSEPAEGDEDSTSKNEFETRQTAAIPNNRRESMLRRSSSSSSPSDLSGRNEQTSNLKDHSTSNLEDTMNSGSEIATPSVVQPRGENSSKGAPSFAEELAKRLGNVLPSNRPVKDSQEADQSSINRFKDDLFAPDGNDVFDAKSENLFGDGNNLFDDDASSSLWKNKPYRAPITNIIPPSLDVPPPMNAEATKPKSAFDDLYVDGESEDSDGIFAPGNSTTRSKRRESTSMSDGKRESSDSRENKFLNVVHGETAGNMATSTPETNDNGGLFGDENDYEDEDVLFGDSKKSRDRTTERSPELAQGTRRTAAPGLSITQADILSSNLGSRLFQRVPRQDSSDSSDTESPMQNSNARGNERIVTESDSSGISIRPNNNTINNTFGLGVDFQPQSESTRLRSEEIYRERFPSDSLFDGGTRQPESTNSTNNSSVRPHEARITETLDSAREEDFDSDDVFGPPPLPKQADSKSKSEVASNDDLFSNSSSESRSRKSFDLLGASESRYDVKITSDRGRGLFDEDVDIFGHSDAPDFDIFGESLKNSNLSRRETTSEKTSPKIDSEPRITSTRNNNDLFSERIIENVEFSLPPSLDLTKSNLLKTSGIFDDSEDEDDGDDLFGGNFLKNDRKPGRTMIESEDDEIFARATLSTTGETALSETKKDSTSASSVRETVANEGTTKREVAKPDSYEESNIERALPSYPTGGLFDNLVDNSDDDDDEDGLFDRARSDLAGEKRTSNEEARKQISDEAGQKRDESESKEIEFRTNCAKIEGLFRQQSVREVVAKISDAGENESTGDSARKKASETSPMRKDVSSTSRKLSNDERDEKDVSSTDGGKISKPRDSPEIFTETTRRDPPKTLSIRLPLPIDDSSQPQRRAVSDKIKILTGKMGDLKLFSPTDVPPLWRKTDDKTDPEYERTESRDSEDGSVISAPNAKSSTIISSKIEDPDIFPSESTKEPAPMSPLDDSGNSETAVSFDIPAQVEVLAVTASKSRARIQAKRRPQSRHARQSALRKSGIDFDAVDNSGFEAEAVESDRSDNTFSGISDNIPTVVTDPIDLENTSIDRLVGREVDPGKFSGDKIAESSSSLAPEDRSEMSFSKGSSLSLNKNTLLSPSTDEEDLFDVPPDLPEDPPKEDTLFGGAPILSPIDRSLGLKNAPTNDKSKESRGVLTVTVSKFDADRDTKFFETDESSKERGDDKNLKDSSSVEKSRKIGGNGDKPTDPLRDSSHDPLEDPSQLFAFVTKTPSPEKGQSVSFKEDASLFTHLARKSTEEARAASKKNILDLFADDSGGDLFSGSLAKSSSKISTRASKSNSLLFDDMDIIGEDTASDLFGGGTKKPREKIEVHDDQSIASKSVETLGRGSPGRGSIFAVASAATADNDDDDDNDDNNDDNNLFVNALEKKYSPESEKSVPSISKITKDTRTRDIFGDQSSGDEDLFAGSKTIGSGRVVGASGSIFATDPDDEDVNDIFGIKSSARSSSTIESRPSAKKIVTRDLKKTAEAIVEDPLSMLQEDD